MVGHGATQAEAIEDLQRLFEERAEYLKSKALTISIATSLETAEMITAVYESGILMGWRAIAAEVGEVFIPRLPADIIRSRGDTLSLADKKGLTDETEKTPLTFRLASPCLQSRGTKIRHRGR